MTLKKFYPLLQACHLYDGLLQSFEVAGRSLLLVQHRDEVFVFENACPHQGAKLDFAAVINGALRCPLHRMEFRLSDGQGIGPAMCTKGLKKYPVEMIDGVLGVRL